MNTVTKKRPLFNLRSRIEDIPREWFQIIEPRIQRPQGTSCWLWDGALDRDGEPVVHVTTPRGTRTMRRVKRIVASLFWNLEKRHDVVHHCGTGNCLNPNHFYISTAHWKQEDRKAMQRHSLRHLTASTPHGTRGTKGASKGDDNV